MLNGYIAYVWFGFILPEMVGLCFSCECKSLPK